LVILAAMAHVGIAAPSAVLAPMVSEFLDDVTPATPDFFSGVSYRSDHGTAGGQRARP
jgi:hypothetical protein